MPCIHETDNLTQRCAKGRKFCMEEKCPDYILDEKEEEEA
jgi:hypothetical protein